VERPASVLVVAHPGHELRLFGWYESARPRQYVLTVGSRSDDVGRFPSTTRLIEEVGASLGSLSGPFLDRHVYAAILAGDAAPFTQWTLELTDALVELAPARVVIDDWQMYNVSHDLVHAMGRVAIRRAGAALGRAIEVVTYDVVPPALAAGLPRGGEAFRLELDDPAVARKRGATASYGGIGGDQEAVRAVEGDDAQRIEVYREVVAFDALWPAPDLVPPYERYGEQRVEAGIYRECIRWEGHVRPIVEAILKLRV
jgi:hypothetical protein